MKRLEKRYCQFDLLLSRRFFELLQRNLPFKGTPEWSETWAEELRKLRELDGWSKREIRRTLDFICCDVSNSGFCFAKNIRSLSAIRKKWSNEMTAFANANLAMNRYLDKKEEQIENEDSIIHSYDIYLNLHSFQTSSEKIKRKAIDFFDSVIEHRPNFHKKRTLSIHLSLVGRITDLLCEFVNERKWPITLFTTFFSSLCRGDVEFWGIEFLLQRLDDFFDSCEKSGLMSGFFYQNINGKKVFDVDRTYRKRVKEFIDKE